MPSAGQRDGGELEEAWSRSSPVEARALELDARVAWSAGQGDPDGCYVLQPRWGSLLAAAQRQTAWGSGCYAGEYAPSTPVFDVSIIGPLRPGVMPGKFTIPLPSVPRG